MEKESNMEYNWKPIWSTKQTLSEQLQKYNSEYSSDN